MREKLLYLQDERCAICGRKYQRRHMVLDHDHALEKEGFGFHARGVLCRIDNRQLIGTAEWSDAKIQATIDYLIRIQNLRKEIRGNVEQP